jgi:plastocyanin
MKGRGRKLGVLLLLAGTAAVPVLVLAPFASGGAHTSATKNVSIRDDFFRAKRITIHSGDRVKWTWRNVAGDHNVHFRKVPRGVSLKPASPTKAEGTFVRKFRKRGTYRYVCTIHEDLGMTGSIKVE